MKKKYVGVGIDFVLIQEDIITQSQPYGSNAHKDVEDIYVKND